MDHAATTSTHPEVIRAMQPYFHDKFANPSGIYSIAKENRQKIEKCRQMIADTLHAKKNEIYFTAGGSEGDNWALKEIADTYSKKGRHIITTKLEHHGILHTCEYLERHGFEVTYLDVDIYGRVNPVQVERAIRKDTILISVMFANNEIGTIQPIKEIGEIAKKHGVLFHTDAVQGFMKLPFRASKLGADLISISGHKIHAVKGIGALYIRSGLRLPPFICGGGQESERRAGTEAMPAIAAFAAAARLDPKIEYIRSLKTQLSERLTAAVPEAVILETDAPHILSASMPGWRSEVIMNFLEGREVYVSKSSACKQGKRSHVLEAIGMRSDRIDGSIRIGLSRYTTEEDIEALVCGLSDARALAHR